MKTEISSVVDGKLTDEQLGKLLRKLGEIERRINENTIAYQDAIDVMQLIIIEGKSALHLGIRKGTHEIKAVEYLIDCDVAPFVPEGWSVVDHKRGGLWKWDPARVFLYLSKKQKKGSIEGNDLRKELADKPVMNANVLDYLLAHPELIPEEWKGKYIFFWGTIYRDSDGNLYVRYLGWNGSSWNCYYCWLGSGFGSGRPAALAS
jgi:hypothetical protein